MANQLEYFYTCFKEQYQLELIAGESGLNNSVSWVYVFEDLGNISFLQGDELLITTGLFSLNHPDWLSVLLNSLEKKSFSGIIINTGNYIKRQNMPNELLSYCNEHNLPLFTMPWEIHISDIVQDIGNQLFMNNYKKNTITNSFQNLISPFSISLKTIEVLVQNGFRENDNYTCALVQNFHSTVRMDQLLNSFNISFHSFVDMGCFFLIFHNCDDSTIFSIFETIIKNTPSAMRSSLAIGVGETVFSLNDIHFSYETSNIAFQISQKNHTNITYFMNLGIDRILYAIPNRSFLFRYYKELLKKIEDYDTYNNSDLLLTLETYFANNKNVLDTANNLYSHRNTVHHRLIKISELLDINLDDADTCLQLQMALKIRHFKA